MHVPAINARIMNGTRAHYLTPYQMGVAAGVDNDIRDES
jgi:hypothetical protein